MKNIAIIFAGGTISTYKDNASNGVFSLKTKKELSRFIPGIEKTYTYSLFTDISPNKYFLKLSDWKNIYEFVQNNYDKFDGFVIAQESDSLIFGASLLSYMFSQCRKPIILISSPFPIGSEYMEKNIPEENIIKAMHFAASDIGEVCIYDNNKLHRAVRTKRNNILNSSLFFSYQSDPLGEIINGDIHLYLQRVHNEHTNGIFPYIFPKEQIFFIKIVPEYSFQSLISHTKTESIQAIVIETLGYGSLSPSQYNELISLGEQGIKIIIIAKNDAENRIFTMDNDIQNIPNSVLLKNTTIWGSYAKAHIALANTETNEEFQKFMMKSCNGDIVE